MLSRREEETQTGYEHERISAEISRRTKTRWSTQFIFRGELGLPQVELGVVLADQAVLYSASTPF
jgi:hypothetical protein